jgi:hypothetical protein
MQGLYPGCGARFRKASAGFGTDISQAYSAAVYVNLAGKTVLIKEDVELMIR